MPRPDNPAAAGANEASRIAQVRECVATALQLWYGRSLDELECANVPGYWRDKRARKHSGHPLHSFLDCDGPFQSTYVYLDPPRDAQGRWQSRTQSWELLKTQDLAATRQQGH